MRASGNEIEEARRLRERSRELVTRLERAVSALKETRDESARIKEEIAWLRFFDYNMTAYEFYLKLKKIPD